MCASERKVGWTLHAPPRPFLLVELDGGAGARFQARTCLAVRAPRAPGREGRRKRERVSGSGRARARGGSRRGRAPPQLLPPASR